MSKQSGLPPPPPGLPARLPTMDSYRPLPPPQTYPGYPGRSPESSRREKTVYHFRGNGSSSHDENRPLRQRSPESSPRFDTSRDFNKRGDSYRPDMNEFSFKMEPPPSIDLSRIADSYRPGPPRQNGHSTEFINVDALSQNNRNYRSTRGGWRPRETFSRKAAERPFLQSNRAPTPDLMPGMEVEDATGVKYLALEDLSDSDEADMDLSSGEENEVRDATSQEPPRKKQVRTNLDNSANGDSVPRWSNPDPYTALPPLDESQRKKLDVVKLIRKARVINRTDSPSQKGAAADDFISFDFGDTDKVEDDESDHSEELGNGMPGAPTAPRAYSHREAVRKIEPPRAERERDADFQRPSIQVKLDTPSDPSLGIRKRNIDDNIKPAPPLPRKASNLKATSSGEIIQDWQVKAGISEAPWCTVDHAATENMGFWLHKEIVDFYNHVKPTSFEDSVRCDLISQLRGAVRRRFSGAEIHPFGSFVAGLYLPTADMDMVFCSKRFLDGGAPMFNAKAMLFKLRDFLISEGFAVTHSVEVISGAKVPLVKYIDRKTGLRVDISFENDTGLVANRTFEDWKTQYPAMPILVTLIKQFLSMRRLNEPVNGGIGGFTVTCLVMSLLQLMPQVQSGNMIPEHHLGEVLMEFLDLYGNEFNPLITAIRVNPPGYVPKSDLPAHIYKNAQKLSVIDPNNPNNDISGGSKNTPTILQSFSIAYNDLKKRMSELHALPIGERHGQSILSVILGGNYSSFDIQKERLRACYELSAEYQTNHERY